jgi:hypothetical protein
MFAFNGYLSKIGENRAHYMSWVDTNNVYSIDSDKNVSLKYRLNFGEYTMPVGALYEGNRYDDYAQHFAIVHPVIETEKYRFITYSIYNERGYAVYDKYEMNVIAHQFNSSGFTSDQYPDLLFWPRFVDDQGRLICVHEPEESGKNYALSIITLK